jgi:hypothetical protein
MMHYVVCPSPNALKYSAVVIATGTARPHEELERVAAELRKQGVRGKVVFDLLTANGTRTRRFFTADFDGQGFPSMNFETVEGDPELRHSSAQFFSEHRHELDTALLTPAMRYALNHGIEL